MAIQLDCEINTFSFICLRFFPSLRSLLYFAQSILFEINRAAQYFQVDFASLRSASAFELEQTKMSK